MKVSPPFDRLTARCSRTLDPHNLGATPPLSESLFEGGDLRNPLELLTDNIDISFFILLLDKSSLKENHGYAMPYRSFNLNGSAHSAARLTRAVSDQPVGTV
jgi:hypothetical protein